MVGKTDAQLTLQDLSDAVNTINRFASLYEKAQHAVKRLGRAEGRYAGMSGRGADPISQLLLGSMEGVVERKMGELVDKRLGKMLPNDVGGESGSAEELEEARGGLGEEEAEKL
jgi:hypothetical protein